MKTDIYIVRYGDIDELLLLAERLLREAGCPSDAEAHSFINKIAFIRYFIRQYSDTSLEIKIIDNSIFVSGTSDNSSFTV